MTTAPILPPVDQPLVPDEATRVLNRAIGLAMKGYKIFPVHPGTKRAGTDAEHSPDGARWGCTDDLDRIRSLWGDGGQFTGYSIGVATQESGKHGVVLIDCDVKDSDGRPVDGPGNWADLHPQAYPIPTAVGHSPRGGLHFPFRADPRRPVKTGTGMVPGVDVRGMGGMFVLREPFYLPAVSDLPMVPDVVCERMPYVDRPTTPEPVDPQRFAPAGEVAARVLQKRDELAAWPFAGRPSPKRPGQLEKANDGAARLAWEAGQYVGAGQVDEAWVVGVLQSAFAGWTWSGRDDEATMMRTVEQQVRKGAGSPKAWVAEPTLAIVSPPALPVPPSPRPAPARRLAPVPPLAPRQASGPLQADVEDDGDVSDAPAATGEASPAVSTARRVRLTPASTIVPRRVRWLWDGRWPLGALALVAGAGGLGKSTIVYDRAARITRGELPGEMFGQERAVLVCATEDSWEYTIAPRLMAAGADLDLIFRVDVFEEDLVTGLVLPYDIPAVGQIARDVEAAMLVLDPLTSRLQVGLDSHKDSETRRALEPLADLADRYRLAVVGLMHLNKSGSSDPLAALNGSTAFGAVARSVSIAIRDPDDEEGRRRLFGTPKNNLGRDDLPTLAYVTVGVDVPIPGEDQPANIGRVEWLDEVEGSIGDAMARAQQDPETRTAIGEAADWLKDYLSRFGGAVESMAVREAGRAEGHNVKTLQRALKRVGGRAESVKDAFPRRTLWTIPTKTPKPLQVDSNDHPATTGVPSTKLVLSVSTDSTSGDSDASVDRFHGDDTRSRQAVAAGGEGTSAPDVVAGPAPTQAPPWAADAPAAEPVQDVPLPCPCGRGEHLHSKGNWRVCPAGHRWHAFGMGALDECPHCPSRAAPASASGTDIGSDDDQGGDAA